MGLLFLFLISQQKLSSPQNESSIHELVKEKEVFTSFAVTPQTTKLMATVHNCFIKMEKALNQWVADMNRRCVLTNSNMLLQKALTLWEDFSKGSPETSDTKPFTTEIVMPISVIGLE